MEIKEESYIYPTEALDSLKKRNEEEMTHEQKIAHENLSRHTKIKDKESLDELKQELMEIDSLKEKHAYKILEIVPEYESTVRAIFSKERVKISDDEIQEILDICDSVKTED